MVDVTASDLMPLAALVAALPCPVSPNTVTAWHTRGAHGERLAVVKIGRRLHTTRSEWRRFWAAVQARQVEAALVEC